MEAETYRSTYRRLRRAYRLRRGLRKSRRYTFMPTEVSTTAREATVNTTEETIALWGF